jgi:hypothetical protein
VTDREKLEARIADKVRASRLEKPQGSVYCEKCKCFFDDDEILAIHCCRRADDGPQSEA